MEPAASVVFVAGFWPLISPKIATPAASAVLLFLAHKKSLDLFPCQWRVSHAVQVMWAVSCAEVPEAGVDGAWE